MTPTAATGPEVLRLVVPGPPVPKGRPRVGGGHARTPERTRSAEEALGWAARAALRGWTPDDTGSFGAELAFHTAGDQAGDIDNLAKLVLDALNGIVWEDDRQVVALAATVTRQSPPARTEIVVWRLPASLPAAS